MVSSLPGVKPKPDPLDQNSLIALAAIFKVDEIDQEYGPQQDGFLGKIDSLGKDDAEIVSVREGLFGQAAPLFGYLAEFQAAALNLKCPYFVQLGDVLILSSRFGRPKINF
jgi:hypothetical protein